MKRIEKEIKKNSTKLIESSLPEINSLDNIPTKAKKNNRLPLFFIPAGALALAAVAIMIPLLMKQVVPAQLPSTSASNNYSSINYYNSNNVVNSNNTGDSVPQNPQTNHTYHFDFANYKPTFSDFNEIAYYSYVAYQDNQNVSNNLAPQKRNKAMLNDIAQEQEERVSSSYIDAYGRKHHPLPLTDEYTFSNFVFFEFDSINNFFLKQRIGDGHIHGLALKFSYLNENVPILQSEEMLILKNEDRYYSCLVNGGGSNGLDNRMYIQFSAHKVIEGFDIVKDATNKRYIELGFETFNDYESLDSITIEGASYPIIADSVHYDNVSVTCSFEDLREKLELNPEYKAADGYGGVDVLVYDAEHPENNTFTLDEFEGTFSVNGNTITLNNEEVVSINGITKVYASEVNKDSHRDLVFETVNNTIRSINVFDIYNKKLIYQKSNNSIDRYGDHYLDMMNGRLVVKLLEHGMTDDRYLIDYGYFSYYGIKQLTIVYQNYFELTEMRVHRVLENDNETLVPFIDTHYRFSSNTPYILEIKMSKYPGNKNPNYPSIGDHQIVCKPFADAEDMPNMSPEFTFLSMENGIYRYQIKFQEKGYSYYTFSFYRFNFDLRVAVDEPVTVKE